MIKKILVLFLLIVSACGRDGSTDAVTSLTLILQFPAVISKSSGHFEAFVKNVEFLKIVAKTNSERREYCFPPYKWETLVLSELPAGPTIEVSIEVWDRKEDGFRRSFPILVGKKAFSKKDLESGDGTGHRIVLHADAPIRF